MDTTLEIKEVTSEQVILVKPADEVVYTRDEIQAQIDSNNSANNDDQSVIAVRQANIDSRNTQTEYLQGLLDKINQQGGQNDSI